MFKAILVALVLAALYAAYKYRTAVTEYVKARFSK